MSPRQAIPAPTAVSGAAAQAVQVVPAVPAVPVAPAVRVAAAAARIESGSISIINTSRPIVLTGLLVFFGEGMLSDGK